MNSDITRYKTNRSGFAILIVLVAFAIIAVLYMMDMKAIFSPQPNTGTKLIQPWQEEDLIVDETVLLDSPEPPKIQLDNPFTIKAPVHIDDTQRGSLAITIDPTGTARGTWHCKFAVNKKETLFKAAFAGNIVPDKTHVDEDGNKDPSALFFITKGKYTESVYNINTNKTFKASGEIFVTGWIMPDKHASGKLTLTTDRKSAFSYTWNQ